jgi:hypothetical protein
MFGLSYAHPARHMREYLSVLMPLARGEAANFSGEEYRVANVKKLVGESYFGTALRLLDNENPSNVSSYSTPLPLP